MASITSSLYSKQQIGHPKAGRLFVCMFQTLSELLNFDATAVNDFTLRATCTQFI